MSELVPLNSQNNKSAKHFILITEKRYLDQIQCTFSPSKLFYFKAFVESS